MGRGGFRRGGRKGGGNNRGGSRGGGGDDRDRNPSWRTIPAADKKHEKLERFYNSVIPMEDEERTEFWDALKRELPNSFRFAGSKGHALAVRRLLEERYAPEIVKIERFDGEKVEAPQAVTWYPDQLAYSMNTPKHIIRKFPPFAAFQKFLVSETSVGNISRQEVVSMIPPLLMDVKPGHVVLDLCAAPGSKSAQIVEMIHKGEEGRIRKVLESFGEVKTETTSDDDADLAADPSDDGRATGLLIANDAEYKRCHMLTHQLKRLSSPNILVTNHDATLFPALRVKDPENPKQQYLKFDRILADVPCSGDGTMRKNMNLWKDWRPGNALGLHTTQVRILIRALQMLKVGGRVVYSTCSMNPVENEAVILTAIDRCGGLSKVDIIDCSERLPGLKRKPGFFQWKIMDKDGKIWNNWEEVQQHMLTHELTEVPGKLAQSMFPRSDENESSSLPLDRCMRVYAHQQDTGGFFITVLEKKAEFKVRPENAPRNSEAQTSNGAGQAAAEEVAAKLEIEEEKAADGEPTDVIPTTGAKRTREEGDAAPEHDVKKVKTESVEEKADEIMADAESSEPVKTETNSEVATPSADTPKPQQPRPEKKLHRNADGSFEEPFKYMPVDHDVIKGIRDFYKLSERFPSDRYMVRNATGEPAKAIYYTSALLRDILVQNEGRGVKFVHGGVKMFMKQDSPSAEVCRWRIQSEGMPIIEGYVGPDRVIRLTNKETFRKLLKEMFPRFENDEWVKLGEIGEAARDIAMGCCVLRVEPDGSDPDFSERMALPLWKSFLSLNLMLPKEDRAAMLLRIFNDSTPVINQSLKDSAKKNTEAAEVQEEEREEKEAIVSAVKEEQGEATATEVTKEASADITTEAKEELAAAPEA
ncbi:S-adenosyl-L-methionine-dependent methyltransferase [Truncatella angustata]|uniref:S-adenosyl-L-methionine-dependent methyltransferase n=1 Tax=Truncatella angustata TaxID=152316 RepID=A0A9P9A358_9PEZI|nr:S-adenosyl-L-methionine-dependent methyltransferase [Truncatella angustata]KAH6659808.1 S-adenosyl-L-methionine-dependent methyltransferase [Truncatella angustata]KAH8196593.1 hypothetical protein TruAng_009251 [Truncatella angustata]